MRADAMWAPVLLALAWILVPEGRSLGLGGWDDAPARVPTFLQQGGGHGWTGIQRPPTRTSHLPSSALPNSDPACSVASRHKVFLACSAKAGSPIRQCSAHIDADQLCSVRGNVRTYKACSAAGAQVACSVTGPKRFGRKGTRCSVVGATNSNFHRCSVLAEGSQTNCSVAGAGSSKNRCSAGEGDMEATCSVLDVGSHQGPSFCSSFGGSRDTGQECSVFGGPPPTPSECSVRSGRTGGACTALHNAPAAACSAFSTPLKPPHCSVIQGPAGTVLCQQ